MPPVFGHGRLRLYLLKLLAEAPRHGYEVIRLLEERFQGLYAPSAGTVYPRLAKLASEGLVSHTEEGGRKVYSLTPAGERELTSRAEELTALERELRDSLTALAAGIRADISETATDLRVEVRRAAASAQADAAEDAPSEDFAAWRRRGPRSRRPAGRARWAEAPDAESERAGSGQPGRGQPGQERAGREEFGPEPFERAARRIQDRVRSRANAGDWQGAVQAGLDGLSSEFGGWSRRAEPGGAGEEASGAERERPAEEPVPDPARELERLLDRFRDDVRDAARDHGVDQEQLREARRQLSAASAHLVALLRSPFG
ncbi:PadR family transcriptional regulator [Streptomyces sp. DSM 44915]|uniref:PadR family transcriptional regulator n=1 Tax=Streptomyces chisholmiae TaxID=3075540 RepID=A0ABU2JM90_9ACTN|nr:PadR family transcriptional regulator [Streptomyces sp. DSM 44915]MDT0265639.1 PadR family transcriptional regulator [Streptomyces sp. DSM 44915]